MVETMSEGALAIGPDGTIRYCNQRFAEMAKAPIETIIGSVLPEHFAGEDAASIAQALRQSLTGSPRIRASLLASSGAPVPILMAMRLADAETSSIAIVVTDLTEVSAGAAEAALRRSEERYRTLVTATTQLVWTTDAEGRIVEDSPLWRAFTGQSVEQIFVNRWTEAVHPDDRDAAIAAWTRSVRDHAPYETEYRLRRHDGVYRHMLAHDVPVKEEDGTIREWIGTGTDITQRKQAEEKLRASEAQFRALVEQQLAGIYILEANGRIAYVNPRFAAMFGYAAEELTGRQMLRFVVRSNRANVREKFAAHISGLEPTSEITTTLRSKGGKLLDVLAHGTLATYQGRPASIGVILDITEQTRAHQNLEASEERFRLLVETAPDAILLYDADQKRFLTANKAAERLFACSSKEIIERGPLAFYPSEQPDGRPPADTYAEHIERALAGEEPTFDRRMINAAGEERLCQLTLVRLPSASARLLRASHVDVTEQRRAEAALAEQASLLDGILNAIPVRVFWKDLNLNYLGCNAAFAHDAGYTDPQDLVGKDDYQMAWRDQADLYRKDDREVIESGAPKLLIEEPQTGPKGEAIALLTSKIPLRSPEGNIEGVLGTYMDITERKRTQRAFAEQAAILATEHDLSPDGILVVNKEGEIVSANWRFAEIFEMPQDLMTGKDDAPVLAIAADQMADKQAFLARVQQIYEHPEETARDEVELRDGRVIDRDTAPMRMKGEYVGRVWYFRDVTERVEAERMLRRLNRTLRTLSRGNAVLIRANDEDQLLREMCRTVVEAGGYRMAWVAKVQHDAAKSVTPVAAAGRVGRYLEKARITWANEPRGRGPTGRAVRSGRPQVTQDLIADPRLAPWRADIKKSGFASSVALPLKDDAGVFGVLTIYSANRGAFNDDELTLLNELAGDLAFGVRALRQRARGESFEKRWRASLETTVGAIASTVEMRDPYTAGHQQRVAPLAVAIANELHLPEHDIAGLYLAAILHDLGKISVPAEILAKPGRLSPAEYELIKAHPQSGYDIIKGIDFPWPIAQMILQHHERLDGSGYPQGLKNGAILPEARILAVADIVEAITSHRPYRPARGIDAALVEIEKAKGQLFEPAAVDACVALFRNHRFTFANARPDADSHSE